MGLMSMYLLLFEGQIPVLLVKQTLLKAWSLVGEFAGKPLCAVGRTVETCLILVAGHAGKVAKTVAFESKFKGHLIAEQILDGIDGVGLSGANGNTCSSQFKEFATYDVVVLIWREGTLGVVGTTAVDAPVVFEISTVLS